MSAHDGDHPDGTMHLPSELDGLDGDQIAKVCDLMNKLIAVAKTADPAAAFAITADDDTITLSVTLTIPKPDEDPRR